MLTFEPLINSCTTLYDDSIIPSSSIPINSKHENLNPNRFDSPLFDIIPSIQNNHIEMDSQPYYKSSSQNTNININIKDSNNNNSNNNNNNNNNDNPLKSSLEIALSTKELFISLMNHLDTNNNNNNLNNLNNLNGNQFSLNVKPSPPPSPPFDYNNQNLNSNYVRYQQHSNNNQSNYFNYDSNQQQYDQQQQQQNSSLEIKNIYESTIIQSIDKLINNLTTILIDNNHNHNNHNNNNNNNSAKSYSNHHHQQTNIYKPTGLKNQIIQGDIDEDEVELMFNDIKNFNSLNINRNQDVINTDELDNGSSYSSSSDNLGIMDSFNNSNANRRLSMSSYSSSIGSNYTGQSYRNQSPNRNINKLDDINNNNKNESKTNKKTMQRNLLTMLGIPNSTINAIEALALQFERQEQTRQHHSKKVTSSNNVIKYDDNNNHDIENNNNNKSFIEQSKLDRLLHNVQNINSNNCITDVELEQLQNSALELSVNQNQNEIDPINNITTSRQVVVVPTPIQGRQPIVMNRTSQTIMVSDFKHLNPRACNEYYLSGTGCKNPPGTCQYSHDYFFTPQQLRKYRDYVKLMPCKIRNCKKTHDTCLQAHSCPKGMSCKDKDKCLFLEH